ncbi:MAG TPA: hypothetical protein VFI95_23485 [Terriglobales bacterium]|nr:hypothetical protein [Terriglobales bacterium]
MTCAEFQEILPDILEQDASGEYASHLRSCSSCSELIGDLRAITQGAKLLCAADEPSPRIWANIQRSLEDEGLIRIPEQPGAVLVAANRPWLSRGWLLAFSAMALLAVASLVYRTNAPVSERAISSAPATPVTAPSVAADQDDQELLADISPSVRATYADDLQSVNDFIHDAETSLAQDPNDDEARHFLMDAYEQKAMVYQLAMDRSMQ